jgi:hypothetical protein
MYILGYKTQKKKKVFVFTEGTFGGSSRLKWGMVGGFGVYRGRLKGIAVARVIGI